MDGERPAPARAGPGPAIAAKWASRSESYRTQSPSPGPRPTQGRGACCASGHCSNSTRVNGRLQVLPGPGGRRRLRPSCRRLRVCKGQPSRAPPPEMIRGVYDFRQFRVNLSAQRSTESGRGDFTKRMMNDDDDPGSELICHCDHRFPMNLPRPSPIGTFKTRK